MTCSFPAMTSALTAIVEHYDSFKDLLHVACPPPPIVDRILNKNLTLETAQQCGIPVPRSFLVSNTAALSDVTRSLGFPFVLKPSEKKRNDEFKASVIQSPDDLKRFFARPRDFFTSYAGARILPRRRLGC